MIKYILLLNYLSLCYAVDYLSKQQRVFQEAPPKPLKISKKYRIGKHLIYDCKSRHFVCVWNKNLKECQLKEKKAEATNQLAYDCRFFKSYKDESSCESKQVHFISLQSSEKIKQICTVPR